MKKLVVAVPAFVAHLILACACFGFGAVSSAQAETYYSWTWIGAIYPDQPDLTFNASGVLGVDPTNAINYIGGSLNGQTITGLVDPTISGLPNKLYPDNPDFVLDYLGFQFVVDNTEKWRLNAYPYLSCGCQYYTLWHDTAEGSQGTGGEFAIAPVASTPLPAAFPLFAGGLGLIGLLARRRKQRLAAALP